MVEKFADKDAKNGNFYNQMELRKRSNIFLSSHSIQKIRDKEAEEMVLAFIQHYVPAGKSPICGNSIYQDRRFLARYMPRLEKYFHYRNLDVSTLKILARTWYPKIAKGLQKKSKHMALSDIYDSIYELQFYRENIFIK